MARENLPHIAFYVGDWRKDMAVQSLSYHHRGIWFELLMLMHCSEDRGRLVLAGKPMPNVNLARLLGLSEREATDAILVLLDAGVASRDESGALYSRRMVRENEIAAVRKQNGSKGGSKTQANREQKPDTDNEDECLKVVSDFCESIGLPRSDGEACYHKWQGNGWTNGGKPIKDWKATIRSWKAAGYMASQRNNGVDKPSGGNGKLQMSVWEIREKIKAIEDELGRTQWKKDDPKVADRRRELFAKKKALQEKLTE